MTRATRSLLLASLAAFFVAGCDGDVVQVCMNCFEHDAEKPLSDALVRSVKLDARVKSLPEEVRNVYFKEWCGIDCDQIIRFDLPSDIAGDVMRRYSIVELRKLSAREQSGLLRAQMDGPPLRWWLREAVPDAIGVATDVNIGQLAEFVLIPDGKITRVYMRAFDM